LEYLITGASTADIAVAMSITEKSVRNYHSSLREVPKVRGSQCCCRQMVKRAKFGNL
jgi:DNA-binding CsgD family transcriptional regulator